MIEQPMPTETAPAPAPPPAYTSPPAPVAPAPAPATNHHGSTIAGWVLIALGALFLANTLLPSFDAWLAPLLFGAVGVIFLARYVAKPDQPWPILPGGALLSLAAVIAWSQLSVEGGGTVLFLGLALTFLAFAAAPPRSPHRRWGYWVAGFSLLIAVLATGVGWAWPLALIAIGGWLLLRRSSSPASG